MPGWMTGAALLGVLAATWNKVKFVVTRLVSMFVVNLQINGDAAVGFLIMVRSDFRKSPYGPQTFTSKFRYIRPFKKYMEVACEQIYGNEPAMFWQGWKPMMVSKTPTEKEPDAAKISYLKPISITVRFVRGMWDTDTLVQRGMEAYNETASVSDQMFSSSFRRFFIHKFVGAGKKQTSPSQETSITGGTGNSNSILADSSVRFIRWSMDDIGQEPPNHHSAVDSLALQSNVLDMVNELRMWKDSKEWYMVREIPWRRAWAIYGPPGTGKTSLVRAIGIDMDMPIFSFDLSSMTNIEMVTAWKETKRYSPCIALMEDIDAVFDKRTNIVGEHGGGLTFDCLLNCIGGAEDNDGIFLVITTNHIEKIDEAIGCPTGDGGSTRPGRIDRVFQLTNPDEAGRRQIASRILVDNPQEIESIVRETDGFSGAQVQEACTQRALELFWRRKNNWHAPLRYVG